ncbi:MAG: SOS response-associated peptidase [Marinoscillum sp.]
MYDRYTLFCEKSELEKFCGAELPLDEFQTYNACPTQPLPLVTTANPKMIQFFHWGQTQQMANNKSISPRLFNLTRDSALSRPAYRKSLQNNRCVILANGFYVWKQVSKKQKVPYFCHFPHHVPFGIAGIYEEFEDFEENVSRTFNMITVSAGTKLSSYQEDMPALLTKDQSEQWLDQTLEEKDLINMLDVVADTKILMHSVSPRISDPANNDQGLITPSAPSDQFGNYTLFS